MARRFTKDAHKLGLTIHADFIIGLPGESRESIRRTIDFAKELDCETIQVSIAHPYPGTEFYTHAEQNGLIQLGASMTDEGGHQLPNIVYPGLDRGELVEAVQRFYDEYYYRPKAAFRVVSKAVLNGDVKRLYKEAREYLSLRSKRKAFVAEQQRAQANGD